MTAVMLPAHGTYEAWQLHRALGERACRACGNAWARELDARKAAQEAAEAREAAAWDAHLAGTLTLGAGGML